MFHLAFFIVVAYITAALLLAWVYFRRYQVARPPIGVIDLGDVAFIMAGIVLIPYIYLAVPRWLVAALLGSAVVSVLYMLCEPVLPTRRAAWLVVVILLAAVLGPALLFGTRSLPFLIGNNSVLVLMVVGVANLWAQSGMRARDATILGGILTVYDVIATSLLPLMTDLANRLFGLPFAPLVIWPTKEGTEWLGIGLGGLLLTAVFPLVMLKGFGRWPGLLALLLGLGAITAIVALLDLGVVRVAVPIVVVLGPLMVLQYVYWLRRRGPERTTWQYLRAESFAP